MAIVPQDITLWVLLVAPGLIAVQIAIWVGVVESTLTDSHMLVASLASSVLVDTVFFAVYEVVYGPIPDVATAESLFFSPSFRPELVLGLLAVSVLVGLVYSGLIVFDATGRLRSLAWGEGGAFRYPGQPWEGVLRGAEIVRVDTADGGIVVGRLGHYSRLDKPRELALRFPQWYDPETGTLVDAGDESVLLFEEDIRRVTVRSRASRGGPGAPPGRRSLSALAERARRLRRRLSR